MNNPNSAANLPHGADNARQSGLQRLRRPSIQLLLHKQPNGAYPTVAEVSERTGEPKSSIYADLRRIRKEGLTQELPPHLRSGNPRAVDPRAVDTPPTGKHSYPLFEAVQAGVFAEGAQYDHDPEPAGVFESDVLVLPADGQDAVSPFAMLVRGDSMTNPDEEFHFPDGSKVLIDPGLTPRVGDFVVVSDSEEGASTLKQMMWLRLPGHDAPGPALKALNPNPRYGPFPYDNASGRFRVVGVVVDSQLPAYRRKR